LTSQSILAIRASTTTSAVEKARLSLLLLRSENRESDYQTFASELRPFCVQTMALES
jgi:hypothetical protein